MKNWHHLHVDEVLLQFKSNVDRGLSSTEASRRLAQYGPNELQAARRNAPWTILVEQFKNILILVLLVALIIYLPFLRSLRHFRHAT
jgi:Ca2+-transporting ATPase